LVTFKFGAIITTPFSNILIIALVASVSLFNDALKAKKLLSMHLRSLHDFSQCSRRYAENLERDSMETIKYGTKFSVKERKNGNNYFKGF
jgi:hypothetical protein